LCRTIFLFLSPEREPYVIASLLENSVKIQIGATTSRFIMLGDGNAFVGWRADALASDVVIPS